MSTLPTSGCQEGEGFEHSVAQSARHSVSWLTVAMVFYALLMHFLCGMQKELKAAVEVFALENGNAQEATQLAAEMTEVHPLSLPLSSPTAGDTAVTDIDNTALAFLSEDDWQPPQIVTRFQANTKVLETGTI
jgi:hypothetical protein